MNSAAPDPCLSPSQAAHVIVVGAGPTGASLARLLALRGIRVTLIEASRSFQRIFRGQALMPSGLEAIAQMGLSATVETVPHETLDAWEFWIEGKRLFRVNEPMNFSGAATGPPCTLVSQPEFLDALIQQADACDTFEFLPATPVRDLVWEQQRVVGVSLGDGRILNADLVIATDGRNSMLRDKAGLTLDSLSHAIDILWFSLEDAPPLRDENVFHAVVKHGNSFGLFRSSQGQLQLGWGLHRGDDRNWKTEDWPEVLAEHSPDWLAAYFRQNASCFQPPVKFSVTVGRAPQWSKPGFLILGDAAHPMSPIRAQGINMAFRDAIATANHLVPVLTGQGQAAVDQTVIDQALDAIQAEREPEIIQAQALQAEELAQGEKLRNYPILRWGASRFAPIVGLGVRQSWLRRQRPLRLGVVPLTLEV